MAVLSPGNAWAVGYYNPNQTLITHWDGASWTQVPSPDPGTGSAWTQAATPDLGGSSIDDSFSAVGASTASDVWAVGGYYNGATNQTMAIHCC